MGPWMPTEKNMAALRRYGELMDRARELDPEAFRPVMIPHYSDDQIWRQTRAMERAAKASDTTEPTH